MAKRCEIDVERTADQRGDMFDLRCRIDGKVRGKLMLMPTREGGRDVMAVSMIAIYDGFRRQGLGTELYEAAARLACTEGRPLASDKSHQRSPAAEAFWQKQRRKGRATCLGDSGGKKCRRWVLRCPAPESLAAPPHLEPVIQAAERELVKWKQERGELFDEDGRVVLRKKGTKSSIKFTPEELALFRDRYFTHNHPPSDFKTFKAGGSLSPGDVYTAVKQNLAEIRAVSTVPVDGLDRIVIYRIERPAGGWPRDPAALREHAEIVSNRLFRRIKSDLLAKRRTHQDAAVAVMHETWQELAPAYGFKYDRFLLDGAQLAGGRRRRRSVQSR